MMAKKKYLDKQYTTKLKANKKCFNYEKKSRYAKNCHFLNKKKSKELAEEAKHT